MPATGCTTASTTRAPVAREATAGSAPEHPPQALDGLHVHQGVLDHLDLDVRSIRGGRPGASAWATNVWAGMARASRPSARKLNTCAAI